LALGMAVICLVGYRSILGERATRAFGDRAEAAWQAATPGVLIRCTMNAVDFADFSSRRSGSAAATAIRKGKPPCWHSGPMVRRGCRSGNSFVEKPADRRQVDVALPAAECRGPPRFC